MNRAGILGAGNIAPAYARTLTELGWIELAVADSIADRAAAFAEHYGATAMSVDDLLADPTIDVVVNLTPAAAHAAVTARILESGRAAYSEKPLGAELAEGRQLVDQATKAGLRLGCAPDTFMGAGLQAARAAIDAGLIGEPLSANAFMMHRGPEWWHPNPEIFYGRAGGPLFDMGPYYLTALIHLLGPATAITASARTGITDRVMRHPDRAGEVVRAAVPTHVTSMIEFASGPAATLVTSFDVKGSRFRNIEIYGTEATLSVPDPNTFGGPLQLRGIFDREWRDLDLPEPNTPQGRGLGLADMLSATAANRPHRASGHLALHVLELMSSAIESSAAGRRIELTTTCERPAPMDYTLAPNHFD